MLVIFTCRKILRHGASEGRSADDILSPLEIHRFGRVRAREPWVQRQAH
jgi:hypothetical protein